MTSTRMAQIVTLARIGVLLGALASIAAVLLTMSYRLTFPFELNYMEGTMVEHVQRILAGKPLYVAPSMEFVPYLYPPGFYAASAAVSRVVGEGFLPLRLVSAASSLGTLLILAAFVRRETGEWYWAIVTGGLFAATYVISGTYFDVGRVDMLAVFLSCAALYLIAFGERVWMRVAAGLLIAAAFHTKQTGALMTAPAVLWLLVFHWRAGLTVAATAAVATVASAAWLDAVNSGWYRFYVFEMPSAFRIEVPLLTGFWTDDILPRMGIASVPALFYFLVPRPAERTLMYAAVLGGLLFGAWMNRVGGGTVNVFMTAFGAIALGAGLGMHAWMKGIAAAGPHLTAFQLLPYVMVLVQFGMLAYDPREHTPSERSLRAGHALVETLRQTPGPVWVPYHGYLATMAGKAPQAHWMAVSDVLMSDREDLRRAILDEANRAIRERRFDLIVQSSSSFPNFPAIDADYVERGPAVTDRRALWPLAGTPRRPETYYVPKPASPASETAR